MKVLVAYFSVEAGRTKALAEKLAAAVSGDLFEIRPEQPYTKDDVNYMNSLARCNREFHSQKEVPVAALPENFEQYDMVLVGFPIWYGVAPIVVNTFCKRLDFTGKKVAAFATSGGSGIGDTAAQLAPYVRGAAVADAKLFNKADEKALKDWVGKL